MNVALCLLALPLLPQTVEDTVAPSFEGVVWSGAAPSGDQVLREVTNSSETAWMPKPPRGAGLDAWTGRPVLILQLPNDRGHGDAIAFAETVGRANADRGLVVAALLPAASVEEEVRESPEPIAEGLVTGLVPDDSPWIPVGGARVVVLGPSGERVGNASIPDDEKAALELVRSALERYPAPRLDAELPDALRDAQSSYFAGEWGRARKDAEKVAKKSAKKDPELAATAKEMVDRIDAFERDLQTELAKAEGAGMELERLATVIAATQRGFPKGAGAKAAKSIVARQRKDMGRSMAWEAAEEYVSLLPERPVLFPEQADPRGKKYAKKLTGLTRRAATFEGNVTRKVRALLARYDAAAARR